MDALTAPSTGLVPTDCSQAPRPSFSDPRFTVSEGDIVVHDVPGSKEQCENGGWRIFGTAFKNEGQCVAFVERRPKP